MSIADGVVDDEIIRRFSAWMRTKNIPFECPGCGKDSRVLARHMVTPSQMMGEGQVNGTVYPMIIMICTHCARSEFFSAVAVGIYKSDQEGQF